MWRAYYSSGGVAMNWIAYGRVHRMCGTATTWRWKKTIPEINGISERCASCRWYQRRTDEKGGKHGCGSWRPCSKQTESWIAKVCTRCPWYRGASYRGPFGVESVDESEYRCWNPHACHNYEYWEASGKKERGMTMGVVL